MSLISLDTLNGTPIFTVPGQDARYVRVHGNSFDIEGKRWMFPAYPPFGLRVIADLKVVAPQMPLSPEAQAHVSYLESIPQLIKERTLPSGFSFVTKPFDHQIDGLITLRHNPRFALFFDAGTGKSKILVDLKRCLPNTRMLVVTPKVTVRNWVKEVALHSGGTLKAVGVIGTPEQKRDIVTRYKEYDVLIASYGTARTMGFPRLYPGTLKVLKAAAAAGAPLSTSGLNTLIKGIRVFSDPEQQLQMALAWALGVPIAQVVRYAATEAAITPQWLKDIKFDIIGADESHNLSNISSQQTKAVLALAKFAPRRYLMSGTPTLGDPRHLYPQMKFLSPAVFPEDWRQFSDMFLVRATWNNKIVTGFKNINIINERVQRVAIRKTKEECLDLPERTIIDMPVAMSPEQVRLYNTLVENMEADLASFFSNGAVLSVQNAAVLLNKLTQVTSGFVIDSQKRTDLCDACPRLVRCVDEGVQPYTQRCEVATKAPPGMLKVLKENPKLDVLDNLLDEILANAASKVIIWGLFHAEIDAIQALLETKKLDFVRVDGATSGNLQTKIDKFNEDKNCRVYLGQVATGVGITLNAATYMIYFALPWSLGHYLQSIDRNYRAGQTQKTTVYRLLAEQTVDTFKAIALTEKKNLSAMLTNKLACMNCERQVACLRAGVAVFDPECKYKKSVTRTIAKAELIT